METKLRKINYNNPRIKNMENVHVIFFISLSSGQFPAVFSQFPAIFARYDIDEFNY